MFNKMTRNGVTRRCLGDAGALCSACHPSKRFSVPLEFQNVHDPPHRSQLRVSMTFQSPLLISAVTKRRELTSNSKRVNAHKYTLSNSLPRFCQKSNKPYLLYVNRVPSCRLGPSALQQKSEAICSHSMLPDSLAVFFFPIPRIDMSSIVAAAGVYML